MQSNVYNIRPNESVLVHVDHVDISPDGCGSIEFIYEDKANTTLRFSLNGGLRFDNGDIHSDVLMKGDHTDYLKRFYGFDNDIRIHCRNTHKNNTWDFICHDTDLTSVRLIHDSKWKGFIGKKVQSFKYA